MQAGRVRDVALARESAIHDQLFATVNRSQ